MKVCMKIKITILALLAACSQTTVAFDAPSNFCTAVKECIIYTKARKSANRFKNASLATMLLGASTFSAASFFKNSALQKSSKLLISASILSAVFYLNQAFLSVPIKKKLNALRQEDFNSEPSSFKPENPGNWFSYDIPTITKRTNHMIDCTLKGKVKVIDCPHSSTLLITDQCDRSCNLECSHLCEDPFKSINTWTLMMLYTPYSKRKEA